MRRAVRSGAHQRGGERGRHRDEAGEERGPFGADPLDTHVPADESDHGDDGGLPHQGRRLTGVRQPQRRTAVQDQGEYGGLDGRDAAHGRRQQSGAERSQHRHRQHREPHLAHQRARRPGDAHRVGAPPPLHGEGPGSHQKRSVQHRPGGPPPVEQRHEDRHHDRCAPDEDTGDGGLGRALGGQHRQVEAHHADGGDQREPPPLRRAEAAERGGAAPADQREQQQAREAVAQGLTTRVRIVAEDAVGGEGPADEEAGDGGERRAPQL
ncbi:hypothetical protein A8W25_03055 [Streptomyces sp. ERV7]|nr:hypothetical protein A8W25_03055 [Streptomyces sp. ERV7]